MRRLALQLTLILETKTENYLNIPRSFILMEADELYNCPFCNGRAKNVRKGVFELSVYSCEECKKEFLGY